MYLYWYLPAGFAEDAARNEDEQRLQRVKGRTVRTLPLPKSPSQPNAADTDSEGSDEPPEPPTAA